MSGIDNIFKSIQFRSSYHKASINLAYTAFWLEKSQKENIESYGITWHQFGVLSALRVRFPYTMSGSGIKSLMIHVVFDVYRVTKELIKKKLITFDSYSPKQVNRGFKINRDGLNLLTRIDKKIKHLDKIIGNLSPGEAEELSILLDKARV